MPPKRFIITLDTGSLEGNVSISASGFFSLLRFVFHGKIPFSFEISKRSKVREVFQ